MRNKITDLNNHLFAQLEKLGDDDITPDQLALELQKSKAISSLATNIIGSAKVAVDVMKLLEKSGVDISAMGRDVLKLDTPDK